MGYNCSHDYRCFHKSAQFWTLCFVRNSLNSWYLKLHSFALLVPLYIFFLVPIIGFPKIILTDFFARLSGYAIVVIFMRLFGSFNVYNPVVLGWKLSLVFNNPNAFGAFSMVLFIEALVLFKELPHWFLITIMCILTPLLFMSRSRTGICVCSDNIFVRWFIWSLLLQSVG